MKTICIYTTCAFTLSEKSNYDPSMGLNLESVAMRSDQTPEHIVSVDNEVCLKSELELEQFVYPQFSTFKQPSKEFIPKSIVPESLQLNTCRCKAKAKQPSPLFLQLTDYFTEIEPTSAAQTRFCLPRRILQNLLFN